MRLAGAACRDREKSMTVVGRHRHQSAGGAGRGRLDQRSGASGQTPRQACDVGAAVSRLTGSAQAARRCRTADGAATAGRHSGRSAKPGEAARSRRLTPDVCYTRRSLADRHPRIACEEHHPRSEGLEGRLAAARRRKSSGSGCQAERLAQCGRSPLAGRSHHRRLSERPERP